MYRSSGVFVKGSEATTDVFPCYLCRSHMSVPPTSPRSLLKPSRPNTPQLMASPGACTVRALDVFHDIVQKSTCKTVRVHSINDEYKRKIVNIPKRSIVAKPRGFRTTVCTHAWTCDREYFGIFEEYAILAAHRKFQPQDTYVHRWRPFSLF